MGLTPQEYARGCLLRIVAQPGRYDQGTWQTVDTSDVGPGGEVSCATTGCVAGTAAMLAGDTSIVNSYPTTRFGRSVYEIQEVITKTGRKVGIRRRGQQLLGLTESDSAWLFSGNRVLPEVVNALVELSEGRELSRKMASEMTDEETTALMNYRVPKPVKRQRVPAEQVSPAQQTAHVHGD